MPKYVRPQSVNLRLNLHNPGHIQRRGFGTAKGVQPELWEGARPHEAVQKHHRFVTFMDNPAGIRAIAYLLTKYYDSKLAADGSPIDTIWEMLAVYAPSNENDVDAYARSVCQRVPGVGPHDKVNVRDPDIMFALLKAIIYHENGEHCCSDDEIREGMRRLGIVTAPKPLARSKTMNAQGAQVVVAGTGGAVAAITAAAPAVPVLREVADFARSYPTELAIGAALAVVTFALVTVFAYIKDRRAGLR